MAACWAPLLSVSAALMFLGIRDVTQRRFTSCEAPVSTWAIVAGSTLCLVTLLQLAQYLATSCSVLCKPSGESASRSASESQSGGEDDPSGKQKAAAGCGARSCAGGRGTWEGCRIAVPFTSICERSRRSTGMLVMTVLSSLVVAFLVGWFLVGGLWVFPLRDKPNQCDPTLLSVSFYLILVALVAMAVVAFLLCIAACCAALLAASICAAARSLLDSMMAQMGFTPGADAERLRGDGSVEEQAPLVGRGSKPLDGVNNSGLGKSNASPAADAKAHAVRPGMGLSAAYPEPAGSHADGLRSAATGSVGAATRRQQLPRQGAQQQGNVNSFDEPQSALGHDTKTGQGAALPAVNAPFDASALAAAAMDGAKAALAEFTRGLAGAASAPVSAFAAARSAVEHSGRPDAASQHPGGVAGGLGDDGAAQQADDGETSIHVADAAPTLAVSQPQSGFAPDSAALPPAAAL